MLWGKLLALSLVLFVGSASMDGHPRIMKGSYAHIKDFPYQVSLRKMKKMSNFEISEHFCGGSIISFRHILTAAHCIDQYTKPPFSFRNISVYTSSSYITNPGTAHEIMKINIHPNWINSKEERFINDIAVITLEKAITFNKCRKKINLPEKDVESGVVGILTGWGLTKQMPPVINTQLQKMESVVEKKDICNKKFKDEDIFDSRQICILRQSGYGICTGDGGSPLVVKGEIVGIVSWVSGDNCGQGTPEIFTNVYYYKNYIYRIVNSSLHHII